MCPDPTKRCHAVLYGLKSAHRDAAADVMSRLDGSRLAPECVIGWALANGAPLNRAIDLLVDTPRWLATLGGNAASTRPQDRAAAMSRLRSLATDHAAMSTPVPPVADVLPQGVSRLPPQRPLNFDLAQLPLHSLASAINGLETNSNPVSNPSYAYPADPLFATWFAASESLGSRTLTMAEMNAVIRSDLAWENGAAEFRQPGSLRLVADPSSGLEAFHELHKFAAGFRGYPALEGRARVFYAGQGGETGALARLTDPAPSNSLGENVGAADEARIKQYFADDLNALRSFPLNHQFWESMTQKVTAAQNDYVQMIVFSSQGIGYFADPREQAKLNGTLDALLTSQPGSPERAVAAQALYRNFEARDRLLSTVSVSGMTAEIQMAQVLHRYLQLDQPGRRVDVGRPDNSIDVVAVYQLYRQMADGGQLTTRATVTGWLQEWGVLHAP